MKDSSPGELIRISLPRVTRSAGGMTLGLGFLTLLIWVLSVAVGLTRLPRWSAISPLSGFALILFGVCLWRLAGPERMSLGKATDKVGLALAALVCGLGVFALVTFFFDFPFPNDWSPHMVFGLFAIPPNTAIALICCGLALTLCHLKPRRSLRIAQGLVLTAGLIAVLALIGYGYKVTPLYQMGSSSPMGLTTAVGVLLFCLGFLAARPDRGLMTILTSRTTGGALARRLLGLAIAIPWILGALLLAGEKKGHYGGEFAVAIFAVLSIIIFTLLIWWNAKLLYYADIKREETEEQLRAATANLERSNSDLQQFAYLASHDLSEPLRMVTSYLQLLSARYSPKLDKDGHQFIGFAIDGAARMQALIADLLAYSRLDTRGRSFEQVPMEQVFQAALSNLKVAIEENEAIVTHDPLPTVWGDPIQLTQLFQNLIGNAIKFHGEEAPRIHVGLVALEKEWQFCVRDNGIGIDPKFFERIFVIFQRLHTRQEYSGTGMGLAICKKVVGHHGGRIWVESKPGAGSTFFFTLPREQPSS